MTHKNRVIAAIASLLAAAAILTLGVTTYMQYRRAEEYRLQLSNQFRRSFTELNTSVSQLDTALSRGIYATTPNLVGESCTEIFGAAQAAASAVGQLPLSDRRLPNTASFLSLVTDYALSLSKASQLEDGFNEGQLEGLSTLAAHCTQLSTILEAVQLEMDEGKLKLDNYEQAMEHLAARIEPSLDDLSDAEKETTQVLQETPTLIYDGPFSEHIEAMTIKMLEGAKEIAEADAPAKAAEFFGYDAAALKVEANVEGKIPAYSISGNVDGIEVYIKLSRTGGYVVEMVSSAMAAQELISKEDGVAKAYEFLENNGFTEMKESYYIVENGVLTVNFAATQNGVVLYPDLIKVSVSMESGAIVGYEAKGYLTHHCERDIPAPSISEESGMQAVSAGLTVLSVKTVIIPTPGENEIFCYEYTTENADGQHVLVYVNAQSGLQEKILMLIEDENGTLTV